jgi:cardiolipin synthase
MSSGPEAPITDVEPPIVTERHTLVLLPEVEAMLRSVFGDIGRARRRVLIECYIFIDDKLGRMLGDALMQAAERGASARVIYDPLGSHLGDASYFDELRAKGVDVRSYRPAATMPGPGTFLPRDHSRIIVADDAAYTGGAAWADEWLPKEWGGGGWHDVCVRVDGPCAQDFARVFEQRWREANAEVATPRDIDTQDTYPDLRLVADTTTRASLVEQRHREAIRRAKRRVWMEAAYFFPSTAMLKDLYEAAARGVDVQIVLAGETDLPIIRRAARSEYLAWLEHGMKIWEYQGRVLHAKFAVIDDDWCTIGTFNANPSSMALVNEINLFVFNPSFVGRVARLFELDTRSCREVTEQVARDVPLLTKAGDAVANNAISIFDAALSSTSDERHPDSKEGGDGGLERDG